MTCRTWSDKISGGNQIGSDAYGNGSDVRVEEIDDLSTTINSISFLFYMGSWYTVPCQQGDRHSDDIMVKYL